MTVHIAITGLACRYPGASTPRRLWENVLARRQQFRRFLDQRMPAADYHSADPAAPDRTYGRLGAFLDGFEFDPGPRRIPRSTVECTDLVHWLALDVAAAALADAGHPEGESSPRARTTVIVGNSLTGEHTRATALRLRWPYVERTVREAAAAAGVPDVERLVSEARSRFLAAFPPITEDTLAGGLSNTIAGRICGTFDFGAGGYTVDGACASSLLAVCTAAAALTDGRADLALAGGVDVSLDPFELVGFAKTRALTPTEMRVYDRRGNGFVPGEGCGFVVLERLDDALAAGRTPYAVIRGWGISSDGKNAITAPRVSGQARAVSTAWAKGGVPDLVEGHGTGTAVGDRVELEALALAAGEGAPRRIAVTSLKSIVGHTKAAAGVGALLKAVASVNRRVIPPTAGCDQPNPVFDAEARALYPARTGEVRDPSATLVAGVSAMGFGGINSHVVVASHGAPDPRLAPALPEARLLRAAQTAELFVFSAPDRETLAERVRRARDVGAGLAAGELPDLSAALAAEAVPDRVRAAVVAHTPEVLAQRLDQLLAAADADGPEVWVGTPTRRARIGFLCPGQGSQDLGTAAAALARDDGLRARADALCAVAAEAGRPDLWEAAHPPEAADPAEARARLAATELAQPALVLATWVWASRLSTLGISPDVVGGHSLGELSAFALAGALDPDAAMRAAVARGRAMAAPAERPAGMTSLATDPETAAALCAELGGLVVANVNAPRQVVVAGERAALDAVAERAAARGITARPLPVTNAFHSPWVADAAGPVRDALPAPGGTPRCELWSSRSDRPIGGGCDVAEHFAAHLVEPVDFVAHARRIAARCDLLIEVGPGRVLSGLVDAIGVGPCLPVEGSSGRDDWLGVLAAAWIRGIDVAWDRLHDGRPVAPVVPVGERRFWTNPCELGAAPVAVAPAAPVTVAPVAEPLAGDVLAALLDEVTARTGFTRASVSPDHRLRDELNLDSIKASEIVATIARRAGVADRVDPAQLASHPLAEIARALVDAGATDRPAAAPTSSAARWVRSFVTHRTPAEPARGGWAGRRVVALGPERVLPALLAAGAVADPHAPDVVVTSVGDDPPEAQIRALRASVDALGPSVRTWVVVQRTGGSLGAGDPGRGLALASFARSVSLERPTLAVAAVDLADDVDAAALIDHLPTAAGFTAVGVDAAGCWSLAAAPVVPGPAVVGPTPGEVVR
ncbi:MAG: beta-ketoacyl synthase N-terminal-like domain-containing protein, partial [Myxococcota bacterium]